MHGRQAALTRPLLGLLLMTAALPAVADKDAAVKAQEGEINHWIEYYRKEREPAGARSTPAAEDEREKVKKEDRENDNSKAEETLKLQSR